MSGCVIQGRSVFAPIQDERAEKMRSLCNPPEYSERLFVRTLADFGRPPEEASAALSYSHSLDFSRSPLKSSYLSHPLRLATYLLKSLPTVDADVLRIAILHNVPEIGGADCSEIRDRFGNAVASGVETLLVDRRVPFESIKAAYYARIFSAGTSLTLVKLLDKMDNLFTLCLNPDAAVRANYLAEIREMLLPFAADFQPDLGRYLGELLDDAVRIGYSQKLKDQLTLYQAVQDSSRIER
jgi:(p)ppGpp synthase/HD superfamily hydrolase